LNKKSGLHRSPTGKPEWDFCWESNHKPDEITENMLYHESAKYIIRLLEKKFDFEKVDLK